MGPSKSALNPHCKVGKPVGRVTLAGLLQPHHLFPSSPYLWVGMHSSVLRLDCVFCLLTHLWVSYSQLEKRDLHWDSSSSCAKVAASQACCTQEPGNSSCSAWQKSLLKCRGHGKKGLWDIIKLSRATVYHQPCWWVSPACWVLNCAAMSSLPWLGKAPSSHTTSTTSAFWSQEAKQFLLIWRGSSSE